MILRVLFLVCAMAGSAHARSCPEKDGPFASLYRDRAQFDEAIGAAEAMVKPQAGLSGMTVPHHLVARDLIASGIRLASGRSYSRVVLLFPDHFKRNATGIATTPHGFDTPYGIVPTDRAAVEALLASGAGVTRSCLFATDHGIHALLPFLRHYLPDAAIVPVAIGIGTTRRDWDRLARALLPLIDHDTLVLQSTDFSHYLPHALARQRDQEVLNVLAAGSLDQIAGLVQPDHVDSAGALYVQTALQASRFEAAPHVLFNRNQQERWPTEIRETTSYFVIGWSADPSGPEPLPGSRLLYLAGDTMFGRGMTRALLDEEAGERVLQAVLALTGGHPMVVNLEGVLLPHVPAGLDHMTLAMPAELTLGWLEKLNVAAVGLANNHSEDLGPSGLQETRERLAEAGIAWFGQGELLDVEGFALLGLTDIGTNNSGAVDLVGPHLLAPAASADPQKPLFAFIHWGREYQGVPSGREEDLTQLLIAHGVPAIVGAHPHVASERLESLAGGATLRLYSLGNFLFDQTAANASGVLLELRLFGQGTWFARLIPLPNLYDLARGATGQQPPKPGSR